MSKLKDSANQKFNHMEIFSKFNSKNEITKSEKDTINNRVDEVQKKWNINDKIVDLFIINIERDQKLREKYAKILIKMLAGMLVALIGIFIFTGLGVLHYSDITFNIFVTGGIAEIFILVRVIVKYLFKDNLTNALNIILKQNNNLKYTEKTSYKSRNIHKKDDKL